MFGGITVHAGDFSKGRTAQCLPGRPYPVLVMDKIMGFGGERIPASDIEDLQIASEESAKKFLGTFLGAIVGGALLGPLGFVAGLLSGGTGKNVTFILKFRDGRRFMGTTDSKAYTSLVAGMFDSECQSGPEESKELSSVAFKNPFLK